MSSFMGNQARHATGHGRLLVVAATVAEAAHVPADLPLVITGLGKTAAAAVTARALAQVADLSDLTVVNIGTAGALRDGLSGLFEPGVVLNHDINADAVRALGYDPQERLVVGNGETVLATGDVFVNDPAVRAELAGRAHLVDMEGYAVAWTAAHFGVPVRLVKHVSDNADSSANDWPAMVEASALELGRWLRRLLRADG
jgi:adenosylhomocysteine nucleosidase